MVHEVDEELREIKREIIESRGLVIKTNNLTNALSADIKSIANSEVSLDTVERAMKVMFFIEAHAAAAVEDVRGRGDLEYLIRRIYELGVPEFSRRDLHRNTQKRFPDAKGLDEPLRMLVDRGYVLAAEEESRPGKAPFRFMVNPRALDLIRSSAELSKSGRLGPTVDSGGGKS